MKPNKQTRLVYSAKYGKATGRKPSSLDSSHELSRQVAEIKRAMVRQFGTAISGHGQLLRSALNEAEAVAWQTPYPHLLFPVLAEEKAAAVSRWAARQRSVRRASKVISLAA